MTGEVPEGFFDGLFDRIKGDEIAKGELVPLTVTGRSIPQTIAMDLARMRDETAVILLEADFASTELRVLALMGEEEGRALLERHGALQTIEIKHPMAGFRDDLASLADEVAHELVSKALQPRDPKRPAWAERNQAPSSPRRSKRR